VALAQSTANVQTGCCQEEISGMMYGSGLVLARSTSGVSIRAESRVLGRVKALDIK